MKMTRKTPALLLALWAVCALLILPAAASELPEAVDPDLRFSSKTHLTVYVDGQADNALSGNYPWETKVSLKAPEVAGKSFRYWTNGEGAVLSYSENLTLKLYSHTQVEAVYGDSAAVAKNEAQFVSVTRTSDQIVFNVMASAADPITEEGVRYSKTKKTLEELKGDDDVTVITASDKGGAENWSFELQPSQEDGAADENETWYATAYVTSGGETAYSEVREVKLSALNYGVSAVAESGELSPQVSTGLCAVTFDPNDGEGAMEPQGVVSGRATALNPNTFTRNMYAFQSWNTQPDGKGASYADGADITIGADVTLYAQWENAVGVPTARKLTYNGEELALADASGVTGAKVTFSTEQDGSYSEDIPTGKDAGSYTVWYILTGDANHSTEPARLDVTIAPKQVGLKWSAASFTYDGKAHQPTAEAAGLVEGDTCTVTVTGEQINAGEYTATATELSNANYKLPEKATQKFTIGKKEIGLKWSDTSFTYNGKAQKPTATATGLVGKDACGVTVDGEGTNAGEYTATASKLTNANYKLPGAVTQKFTIAKAEQAAPAAPKVSKTDTKSITVKTVSGEEYSLDGKTWQKGGSFSGLKANTKYQVYARKAESANYQASPASQAASVKTKSGTSAAQSLNKGLKVTQTGSQLNIEWGKVKGATKYDVWVQYCGTAYDDKPTVTIKASEGHKTVVKVLKKKRLKLKKNLRVKIVARKGKKKLAKSITAHVVGRLNRNFTNAKSIKLKTRKLTLKKGKKAKIQAETVLVDARKKQLTDTHAKEFRYASSDKSVATVSKSGKVKAKGKGKCTIYVYSRNGLAKSVKVTVK